MTIEKMHEEDEAALLPYIEAINKQPDIKRVDNVRPKVVGDPYATFAKGPNDIPLK